MNFYFEGVDLGEVALNNSLNHQFEVVFSVEFDMIAGLGGRRAGWLV
jgi:hypothetical protein